MDEFQRANRDNDNQWFHDLWAFKVNMMQISLATYGGGGEMFAGMDSGHGWSRWIIVMNLASFRRANEFHYMYRHPRVHVIVIMVQE